MTSKVNEGHKRLSVFPGISENSSYTFIYESILKKKYMNTNIMNTQTFYFNKYDLKGHLSFREFEKILPSTFIYE